MLSLELVAVDLVVTGLAAVAGVGGMWWLRRRTTISARNLWGPAVIGALTLGISVTCRWWAVAAAAAPLCVSWIAGAVVGARWRAADLGAGEELRNHELARRWLWESPPHRARGERVYLRGQGELVHERSWPDELAYVSMTTAREHGRACRSAPASTS